MHSPRRPRSEIRVTRKKHAKPNSLPRLTFSNVEALGCRRYTLAQRGQCVVTLVPVVANSAPPRTLPKPRALGDRRVVAFVPGVSNSPPRWTLSILSHRRSGRVLPKRVEKNVDHIQQWHIDTRFGDGSPSRCPTCITRLLQREHRESAPGCRQKYAPAEDAESPRHPPPSSLPETAITIANGSCRQQERRRPAQPRGAAFTHHEVPAWGLSTSQRRKDNSQETPPPPFLWIRYKRPTQRQKRRKRKDWKQI